MNSEATVPATSRSWTEAPASVNIRFGLGGYDVQLTLRGESGAELLHKLNSALSALGEMGAVPASPLRRTATEAEATNGHEPVVEAAPVCAIHGTPMTQRQNSKTGAPFWSCGTKLADGSWCPYRPVRK